MTETKNRYIMKLTPVGAFFFGGENTFGGALGDEVNYFSKSNYLPQQTALFGLLRYLLLEKFNLLNADADKKADKIGTSIFYNADRQEKKGIIERISPVFLIDERQEHETLYWLVTGLDKQRYTILNDKKEKVKDEKGCPVMRSVFLKFHENKGAGTYYLDQDKETFQIEKFNYKETQNLCVANASGWINLADLYTPLTKVGVRKNNRKKEEKEEEEENFYKQTFLKLKEKIAFACEVHLAEDVIFKEPFYTTFGADQGYFKIEFLPYQSVVPFEVKPVEEGDLYKITLLSDAFITEDFLNDIDFAINYDADFRYINTTLKNHHQKDYTLSADRKKTDKFNLLSKGSVFFTRRAGSLSGKLLDESYRRIGFNYFSVEPI